MLQRHEKHRHFCRKQNVASRLQLSLYYLGVHVRSETLCVKTELTQKPRWLRDLIRFLPLRSQFVLSGNVRDLQIHEPAPSEVTAVPLATILVDQLRKSGYQRIVTFDPIIGFRGLPAPSTGAEGSDELLRT